MRRDATIDDGQASITPLKIMQETGIDQERLEVTRCEVPCTASGHDQEGDVDRGSRSA